MARLSCDLRQTPVGGNELAGMSLQAVVSCPLRIRLVVLSSPFVGRDASTLEDPSTTAMAFPFPGHLQYLRRPRQWFKALRRQRLYPYPRPSIQGPSPHRPKSIVEIKRRSLVQMVCDYDIVFESIILLIRIS